jgi:hypothetical protein
MPPLDAIATLLSTETNRKINKRETQIHQLKRKGEWRKNKKRMFNSPFTPRLQRALHACC